jgi:hypothetical protein
MLQGLLDKVPPNYQPTLRFSLTRFPYNVRMLNNLARILHLP